MPSFAFLLIPPLSLLTRSSPYSLISLTPLAHSTHSRAPTLLSNSPSSPLPLSPIDLNTAESYIEITGGEGASRGIGALPHHAEPRRIPGRLFVLRKTGVGGGEGQGRGSPPLPEDLPLKLTSSGRAIADDMNSFIKMSGLRQQDLVVIREELAWVAKQPRVL